MRESASIRTIPNNGRPCQVERGVETTTRVRRDCMIGDERFALLVETEHGGGIVFRTAVHSQDFDRRIGGARTVESGGLLEVGHLARGMRDKCAAAFLPADGEKTLGCTGDPLPNHDTRVLLLREHLRAVKQEDPGVIFGPDVSNNESVMDAVARSDGLLDHVTGLSGAEGGLSIDAHGFTAHGLLEGLITARAMRALELESATIQGFGAVGAHFGLLLAQQGIRIRAISFKRGMFVADGSEGLEMDRFFKAWQTGGDHGLETLSRDLPTGVRYSEDRDALLEVTADIFVPAARTEVLVTADQLAEKRAENPDCRDIADFVRATDVQIIVEGANHPLSDEAVRYAESQGLVVLKDYIVNCGGLIGCYVEWAHRDDLRAAPDSVPAMREKALGMVRRVVRANVKRILQSEGSVLESARNIVEENRGRLSAARRNSDLVDHDFAKSFLKAHLEEPIAVEED